MSLQEPFACGDHAVAHEPFFFLCRRISHQALINLKAEFQAALPVPTPLRILEGGFYYVVSAPFAAA